MKKRFGFILSSIFLIILLSIVVSASPISDFLDRLTGKVSWIAPNSNTSDSGDATSDSNNSSNSAVVSTDGTDLSCTDSDGGLDYYNLGVVYGLESDNVSSHWQDYCGFADVETGKLVEYICDENGFGKKFLYSCQYGCKDGACLSEPASDTTSSQNNSIAPPTNTNDTENFVTDTDLKNQCAIHQLEQKNCFFEGVGYTIKRKVNCQLTISYEDIEDETFEIPPLSQKTLKNGIIIKNPNGCESSILNLIFISSKSENYSTEDCTLKELEKKTCFYLATQYIIKRRIKNQFEIYYNGLIETFELPELSEKILKNGIIIKSKPSSLGYIISFSGEEKISIIPEKDKPQTITENSFCQGCELDAKCYPMGYRKSGEFCSDKGSFIKQTADDELCDNNFECVSNVCVNGKCVSGSLIQSIITWFKKLFGGK